MANYNIKDYFCNKTEKEILYAALQKLYEKKISQLEKEYPDVNFGDIGLDDLYELDDYDNILENIDNILAFLDDLE